MREKAKPEVPYGASHLANAILSDSLGYDLVNDLVQQLHIHRQFEQDVIRAMPDEFALLETEVRRWYVNYMKKAEKAIKHSRKRKP